MLRIEKSSWLVFPLISMKCPSLSLLVNFGLKSILLDIRMTTAHLFLRSIYLENLFPTLYGEVMTIFDVEVCFLDAKEGYVFFSHPFC